MQGIAKATVFFGMPIKSKEFCRHYTAADGQDAGKWADQNTPPGDLFDGSFDSAEVYEIRAGKPLSTTAVEFVTAGQSDMPNGFLAIRKSIRTISSYDDVNHITYGPDNMQRRIPPSWEEQLVAVAKVMNYTISEFEWYITVLHDFSEETWNSLG